MAGELDELAGKVKQTVGDAVGDSSVKAEGAILQRSGNTCVGSIALGEPLTPADPEISLRIYYAQAGEELFAIARRFHVSPAQMLAANDLAEGTTAIDAPQRLLVPGAGG